MRFVIEKRVVRQQLLSRPGLIRRVPAAPNQLHLRSHQIEISLIEIRFLDLLPDRNRVAIAVELDPRRELTVADARLIACGTDHAAPCVASEGDFGEVDRVRCTVVAGVDEHQLGTRSPQARAGNWGRRS